nr:immunoglobulin heavy chain junction region [Macaca mulatta]MOV42551.1 immunoglobulin heavy chain junction region [Macaca mulatta]MOV43065.1 immunoglobulin heavy chain junction region [Macaca mulatta]MOV45072.1 immunoglobulin heavy chain junction region [Macaca mulatta]MOV47196.1 immunoglobulin heavy chain junction region [Macaca mulatta]
CAKDERPSYHYGNDYYTDGFESW